MVKNGERTLSAKASTPMTSGYRPELDVSAELNSTYGNYYQSLSATMGSRTWTNQHYDRSVKSHLALP